MLSSSANPFTIGYPRMAESYFGGLRLCGALLTNEVGSEPLRSTEWFSDELSVKAGADGFKQRICTVFNTFVISSCNEVAMVEMVEKEEVEKKMVLAKKAS